MLIGCDVSSLVIDTLCKQAVEGNAAVAIFYFDFADPEEQSPAAIMGSVLKQVVSGRDKVPEGIVKAFRNRDKVISETVSKIFFIISSSRLSPIASGIVSSFSYHP